MTRGRKPKPTQLRIVGGNAGRRPLPDEPDELDRDEYPIEIPAYLLEFDAASIDLNGISKRALKDRARALGIKGFSRMSDDELRAGIVSASHGPRYEAWAALLELLETWGVLQSQDTMALGLLVDAYAEYLEARRNVIRFGPFYETVGRNGLQVKQHPEVKRAQNAWARVKSMLTEFGMTPSARTRVAGEPETPEDEFEQWDQGGTA